MVIPVEAYRCLQVHDPRSQMFNFLSDSKHEMRFDQVLKKKTSERILLFDLINK